MDEPASNSSSASAEAARSQGRRAAADWARVEAALAAGKGTVDIEHDERRIWVRVDDVAYAVRVVPRRRGAGFSS